MLTNRNLNGNLKQKRNSQPLLLGMHNGRATLEDSLMVPYKTNNSYHTRKNHNEIPLYKYLNG